jgi:Zn-dependent protease
MALVAIAGPLSNLMQAAIAVAFLRALGGSADPSLGVFLGAYVRLNLLLAAFNMIPVPPLDGYNVLMGLVSNFWVQRLEPLRQQGPILLLLLVFVGGSLIYPVTVMPMYQLFSRIVGAPV